MVWCRLRIVTGSTWCGPQTCQRLNPGPVFLVHQLHDPVQLISQMVYPDLEMLRGVEVLFLDVFQGGQGL